MKNFNGYVLFGKLFREPSENVTLPKKRNVCMTLMKRVQYTLMLAYKLRIERSRVRSPLVAPSCPWARQINSPRMLILTSEAVAPFRHKRKNADWKVIINLLLY